MEETAPTIELPEGVEVKPAPHDMDYNAVWVDGVAMGISGDGLSTEELEVYASRVRRSTILEDAERRAEDALHRGSTTADEAGHAAAFIRDFVLEVLFDRGFVTDAEQLGNVAWRIAYGLTPLTVKFAHVRQLEVYIGTNQEDEIPDGLVADALNRVAPIVEAYRSRI